MMKRLVGWKMWAFAARILFVTISGISDIASGMKKPFSTRLYFKESSSRSGDVMKVLNSSVDRNSCAPESFVISILS